MGKGIGDSVVRPLKDALDGVPRQLRRLAGRFDDQGKRAGGNGNKTKDMDRSDVTGNRGNVEQFDVGTYKDLKSGEVSGDRLQHDHIPSNAALVRAREVELGESPLSPAELAAIRDNGIAVELSNELHYASRTYGGRNSQSQIAGDAADLVGAMNRDLAVLGDNLTANSDLTPSQIDSVLSAIREGNRLRGIG